MSASAQQLVGDSQIEISDKRIYFERNDPFALSLWLRIDRKGASGPLVTRSGGLFDGNRGYEVILRGDGTFSAALHHVFPDNSIEIETTRPLDPGGWHHLALTYDGSSRAVGLQLFFDGQLADTRIVVDNLQQSILRSGDKKNESWVGNPPLRIGRRHDETLQDVSVDELRVYDRRLTAFEVAALAGAEDPIGDVLRRPDTERTRRAARGARRLLHRARRARICRAVQGSGGGSRQGERDPHVAAGSDGDARAAEAAADVRPRARRLRRADGARDAGHASSHRRLPGETAAEPPWTGALAPEPAPSADRPG